MNRERRWLTAFWMVSAVPTKCSSTALSLGRAFHRINSLDSKSNGASWELEMKRGSPESLWSWKWQAHWTTPILPKGMGFILMFSMHLNLSTDHCDRRVGTAPGSKYLSEDRKDLGINVGHSRGLLISLFLLTRHLDRPLGFFLGGTPCEACF